jgi:hypothetical protein
MYACKTIKLGIDVLAPLHNLKKIFLVVNNQVYQLGLDLGTLKLPCFTRKLVFFVLVCSPSRQFIAFYA